MTEDTSIFLKSDSALTKQLQDLLNEYMQFLNAEHRQDPELCGFGDYLFTEVGLPPLAVSMCLMFNRLRNRDSQNECTAEIDPSKGERSAIYKVMAQQAHRPPVKCDRIVNHLSHETVRLIFDRPIKTASDLRNRIMFGLILCAGINEEELAGLTTKDLFSIQDRFDNLRITQTDGTTRIVGIYDDVLFGTRWLPQYLDTWMNYRGIADQPEEPVFPSPRQKKRRVAQSPHSPITPRAIRKMVRKYTDKDGNEPEFTILDIRRTFARRLYLAGIPFDEIHMNLGHAKRETTRAYIGLPWPEDYNDGPRVSGEVLLGLLREWQGW
jgi:integrase